MTHHMAQEARSNRSLQDMCTWVGASAPVHLPLAIERATGAFQDTIACIIAGLDDPATKAVLAACKSTGTGFCTVIGTATTLAAENAALVNGTAAHAIDFDDNFLPATTHASAVLVPALLALGEEIGASGHALIDAYIHGLELQAWLGRQMLPIHYSRGWHATSTIGAIGSAVACSRLLCLKPEAVLNAISIACSMAGGSKKQFGSMAKPLHAGLAAKAGVSASRLAEAGLEANSDPFAGDWGFLNLYGCRDRLPPSAETRLAIITDGLAQKRFPCCASAHRSLDAIVELLGGSGRGAETVDSVKTTIPTSNYDNLRFDDPKDEKEARFSMTYCGSLALLFGTLRISDFTPGAIHRPEVRTAMKKIKMLDAGPKSDAGTGIWDTPAVTEIRFKDGHVVKQSVRHPVGSIQAPLTGSDAAAKFADCVAGRISDAARQRISKALTDFQTTNVRGLTALLGSATDPSAK